MKGVTLIANKGTRSQPPYRAGILRPLESLSESASSQLSRKPESGLCEAVGINIISLFPSIRVWSNRSPRTPLFGPQGENMIFSYPTYTSFDGKSSSKVSPSNFSELVKRLRNVSTFFFVFLLLPFSVAFIPILSNKDRYWVYRSWILLKYRWHAQRETTLQFWMADRESPI